MGDVHFTPFCPNRRCYDQPSAKNRREGGTEVEMSMNAPDTAERRGVLSGRRAASECAGDSRLQGYVMRWKPVGPERARAETRRGSVRSMTEWCPAGTDARGVTPFFRLLKTRKSESRRQKKMGNIRQRENTKHLHSETGSEVIMEVIKMNRRAGGAAVRERFYAVDQAARDSLISIVPMCIPA